MLEEPEPLLARHRPEETLGSVRRMGRRAGRCLCEFGAPTNNRFLGIAGLEDLAALYDESVLAGIGFYRMRHPQRELSLAADPRVAELDRERGQAWFESVLARAFEIAKERARKNPWVAPSSR